jgi:hypothetical protein
VRVGIVGQLMSGKTTLAQMLIEEFEFERIALADALKDDCVSMLNWTLRRLNKEVPVGKGNNYGDIDRETIEEYKPVFRTFLQWYGTDFWRKFMESDEHWLHRLRDELLVRETRGGQTEFVTDDVRFFNEAAYLRGQLGYTIVRIERPWARRQPLLLERYPDPHELDKVLTHQSETEVPYIETDFTVQNDFDTPEQLSDHVRETLIPWLKLQDPYYGSLEGDEEDGWEPYLEELTTEEGA